MITTTRATRECALLLRRLYRTDSKSFEELMASLPGRTLDALQDNWFMQARDSQIRPPDCKPIWLRMAGRGEGKTRSAAEETLDIFEDWGPAARGVLCSKTKGDVRKVMIEGESGLQACAQRRGYNLDYKKSLATVYHPAGGVMYLVSSETPDEARGLQSNWFWMDEISSWRNAMATFDNIYLGWRLKDAPEGQTRGIITTTPKPNPIMYKLTRDEIFREIVTVTHGRTADNADNLTEYYNKSVQAIYAGTRLGLQELDGILLDGVGMIFHQDLIHQFRVRRSPPNIARRVVAVDPSIDNKETSDEAGVVVVGCTGGDWIEREGFVYADRTIGQAKFSDWARRAVEAFVDFDCDCVVAEVNQGGSGVVEAIEVAAAEMSRRLGRYIEVPVRPVWAKLSKKARAEPIGALYERGRVHHVGIFPELEKEMSSWIPGYDSPNRMDALVHGLAHLFFGDSDAVGDISGYF